MKQNPAQMATSTAAMVAKNSGPIFPLMTIAPIPLPTIYELIYQTQK